MQYPVLSVGDRGYFVELLQKRLQDWGLNPGPADGIFGEGTKAAVIDFQGKRETVTYARKTLVKDGIVGAETWAELTKTPVQEIEIVRVPTIVTATHARHVFGRTPTLTQMDDLNRCMARFEITKAARIRHFLSQIAHESGGLQWLIELWGPSAAQRTYQGRMGNTQPGDGFRFRGAGAIQLTGRNNYTAFSKAIGDNKVVELGAPYVAEVYPFSSAGWFWAANGFNELCDRGASVVEVTRRVNGGHTGLTDRIYYYNRACQVIT